jgi:hypothetical protein
MIVYYFYKDADSSLPDYYEVNDISCEIYRFRLVQGRHVNNQQKTSEKRYILARISTYNEQSIHVPINTNLT